MPHLIAVQQIPWNEENISWLVVRPSNMPWRLPSIWQIPNNFVSPIGHGIFQNIILNTAIGNYCSIYHLSPQQSRALRVCMNWVCAIDCISSRGEQCIHVHKAYGVVCIHILLTKRRYVINGTHPYGIVLIARLLTDIAAMKCVRNMGGSNGSSGQISSHFITWRE